MLLLLGIIRNALNSLTEYRAALDALRTSLCLDPQVADVWCNLGLAYFGLELLQRRTFFPLCYFS